MHRLPARTGLGARAGGNIIPIFGTKRRTYLAENLEATEVLLTRKISSKSTPRPRAAPPPARVIRMMVSTVDR